MRSGGSVWCFGRGWWDGSWGSDSRVWTGVDVGSGDEHVMSSGSTTRGWSSWWDGGRGVPAECSVLGGLDSDDADWARTRWCRGMSFGMSGGSRGVLGR